MQSSKQLGFLLLCRGSTRAKFRLRMVRHHSWRSSLRRETDENVSQCLRRVIGTAEEADRTKWDTALSVLEWRSPVWGICSQKKEAACLDMIHNRHSAVAASIMTCFTDSPEQSFEALRICERISVERQLTVPTWEALVESERPSRGGRG